jgi:hypothetical protein
MAALQRPVSGGREHVSMHARNVQKTFPVLEHPLYGGRERRRREREREERERGGGHQIFTYMYMYSQESMVHRICITYHVLQPSLDGKLSPALYILLL